MTDATSSEASPSVVTKLVIDPSKSSVRLRTFAEGLFSRLAHDLELVCRGVTGSAERVGDDKGSAVLEVPIARIEVGGTVKDGRVDPRGLSPSDREDCVCKMRKDVFHVQGQELVHVEATLEGGKVRVRITPPKGRVVERPVNVRIEPAGDSGARITGSFDLSLSAIGSDPVKGPMNAFRVKDNVEVLFELVFEPAPS